ncbi:hypothetical protein P9112_010402 [Eukaryota sp. TZLM1-RC]
MLQLYFKPELFRSKNFNIVLIDDQFINQQSCYLELEIPNIGCLTLHHALNCSKLITYRSSLHDPVRDTLFNIAQTVSISCNKEPLLKQTRSRIIFGSGDKVAVYCDWIDNSEATFDFVSCNDANDTVVHRGKLGPVSVLDF